MALPKFITQREGSIRIVSTIALAIIAVRSFINGKRLRGLLATGGAVAVGSTVSTLEPTDLDVVSETEDVTVSTSEESVTASTIEPGALQCPICNEPIVPGEARRPNENDDIVHEACL